VTIGSREHPDCRWNSGDHLTDVAADDPNRGARISGAVRRESTPDVCGGHSVSVDFVSGWTTGARRYQGRAPGRDGSFTIGDSPAASISS
jgi:hypothetical protein